jgi:hypothetical protein
VCEDDTLAPTAPATEAPASSREEARHHREGVEVLEGFLRATEAATDAGTTTEEEIEGSHTRGGVAAAAGPTDIKYNIVHTLTL